MRQHFFKQLVVGAVLSLTTLFSFAQDNTMSTTSVYDTSFYSNPSAPLFSGTSGYRTWSIGLHGGMLAPTLAIGGRNDFSKWKPSLGYGLYIKKQLSHHFGLQLDFLRGEVKATNEKLTANGQPQPGPFASFNTELHWSVALSGVYTVANINWTQLRTAVQPYVSFGAGINSYNPTNVTNGGTTVEYKKDGSINELFIPIGLGLKFNVSRGVNIDLGYTMNFVDGDNFDGQFKEPFTGDKFSYSHFGLEFALGNKSKPQLARHNAPAQLARNLREENDAMRASLESRLSMMRQDLAAMNALRDEMNRMKMDSDGDGVSDYFDKCPGTPAGVKVDGAGCPLPVVVNRDTTIIQQQTTYVITDEDKMIVSEAIRNLEFDFGKATIRPRSYPSLNRVAALLVQKGFSLKLAGHTDNVGSDAANMKLSRDRAASVRSYLLSQGASASKIEATGYGESQPIETNNTAAGRQKNRRVEFTLY